MAANRLQPMELTGSIYGNPAGPVEAGKSKGTTTMTIWNECTEERYDEMLGALPPIYGPNGFLVGEPNDHVLCSVTNCFAPNFAAFIHTGGKFYEADHCLTVFEFKAVKPADVVQS